ncbi:MAG: DUF2523 domain-containing protein [Pseudomonadota bacterium]
MPLAAWLLTFIGPLVIRALIAIGITTVTFTGVSATLEALIAMAQQNWSNIGSDVLGLASIAGIPECIGIIAGAMSTRVAMWAAVSATKWVTGGGGGRSQT